jgi:hypothetical protein
MVTFSGVEAQVLPGSPTAAFIFAATPLALLPRTVVFDGMQAAECNARQWAANFKLFARVFQRMTSAGCLAHEERGEHNDEQPELSARTGDNVISANPRFGALKIDPFSFRILHCLRLLRGLQTNS